MSFPYPSIIITNNITSIYTIYGKKDCMNCMKIKEFLENNFKSRKVIIKYYDIDELIQNKIVKNYLDFHEKMLPFIHNHKTIPIIFLNGQFIGGYDDFMNYFKKFETNKKIKSSDVNQLKTNKDKEIDKLIQKILKKLI